MNRRPYSKDHVLSCAHLVMDKIVKLANPGRVTRSTLFAQVSKELGEKFPDYGAKFNVAHLIYTKFPEMADDQMLHSFNLIWKRVPPYRELKAKRGGTGVLPGFIPQSELVGPIPPGETHIIAVEKLVEINRNLERDIASAMDLCEEVGKRNRELEEEIGQLKGKVQSLEVYVASLEQTGKVRERLTLYDMTGCQPVEKSGLQDREVLDALKEHGYKFKRRNGKHPIFVHPVKGLLVIPNTIIGDFRKDILGRICKEKES